MVFLKTNYWLGCKINIDSKLSITYQHTGRHVPTISVHMIKMGDRIENDIILPESPYNARKHLE